MAAIQEGDPPVCGPAAEVLEQVVCDIVYGGCLAQGGLGTQRGGFRGGRRPLKR